MSANNVVMRGIVKPDGTLELEGKVPLAAGRVSQGGVYKREQVRHLKGRPLAGQFALYLPGTISGA